MNDAQEAAWSPGGPAPRWPPESVANNPAARGALPGAWARAGRVVWECLRITRAAVCCAGLAALACLPLRAAIPPDAEAVQEDWAVVNLAPRLSVFRDPTGAMTLEDVRSAFAAGRFIQNRDPILSFGYTTDAIWLHVALPSVITAAERLLVELRSSRLDQVDWHVITNGRLTQHAHAGLLQPAPAGHQARFPALPLAVHADETVELLVRVQSVMSIALPLAVWRAAAYPGMVSRRGVLAGLYFGYMLALVLSGIVFAFFARDRGYLVYSLAAGTLTLVFFCRDGLYVASGLPFSAFWARNGVQVLNELGLVGALLFMRCFFEIHRDYPRGDRLVWLLVLACILTIPYCMFAPLHSSLIMLIQLKSLLIGLGLIIPAAILYFRKVQIARFYLLAWLVFWLVTLWDILQFRGLVPVVTVPGTGMRWALALSYTLFLAAMGDRILQHRRAAQEAQAHLYQLQQETNAMLQAKVAERTRELELAKRVAEQANAAKTRFFSNISHDLRAPLNSLVGLSQSLWLECGDRDLPPEFTPFIHQIHQGGLYLSQMMDNILDLTAIEAGKDAVRIRPFPLPQWSAANRDVVAPIVRRGGGAGSVVLRGPQRPDLSRRPGQAVADPAEPGPERGQVHAG